jgi:hypothetical protein
MANSVSDEHPELYHYTTVTGLHGIISSQTLRATQISFLNDAEEQIGFFKHRSPVLLAEPIRAATAQLYADPIWRKKINAFGGYDEYHEHQKQIVLDALRDATLTFDNPYVTSFCTAKDVQTIQDGLLSQWRGYGEDGGYAIVFDTLGIELLLQKEAKLFSYQLCNFGDVHYHRSHQSQENPMEEIREYEEILQKCIFEFLIKNDKDELDPAYDKVSYLSCIYKHWGFHEEREVRIVIVPKNQSVIDEEKEQGEVSLPQKIIGYRERGGCLIPYISLFENLKLPIKRVIVGPHPERDKRVKAVNSLLDHFGVDAKATSSEIPYLGR